MHVQRESEIFDNGRRGEPLSFCDCVQCFGMCLPNKGVRCYADLPGEGEDACAFDRQADSVVTE